MKNNEITEGLGELADGIERDHEVQMARAELYKMAKYTVHLHKMLSNVSEEEGLEGWVQSKITKAADMIGSVYHHLDYETNAPDMNEAQSPAQKAAFAKMLAKKSGKKPEEGKEKETDEGNAYSGAVAKAKMNGKKKGDKVKGPDGDEITLEEKTPKKMDVTDADKKANSPAYQQMKKGNPRYNDKTTKEGTRTLPERGSRAKKSKKYTSDSYNATLQANLAALITK